MSYDAGTSSSGSGSAGNATTSFAHNGAGSYAYEQPQQQQPHSASTQSATFTGSSTIDTYGSSGSASNSAEAGVVHFYHRHATSGSLASLPDAAGAGVGAAAGETDATQQISAALTPAMKEKERDSMSISSAAPPLSDVASSFRTCKGEVPPPLVVSSYRRNAERFEQGGTTSGLLTPNLLAAYRAPL